MSFLHHTPCTTLYNQRVFSTTTPDAEGTLGTLGRHQLPSPEQLARSGVCCEGVNHYLPHSSHCHINQPFCRSPSWEKERWGVNLREMEMLVLWVCEQMCRVFLHQPQCRQTFLTLAINLLLILILALSLPFLPTASPTCHAAHGHDKSCKLQTLQQAWL